MCSQSDELKANYATFETEVVEGFSERAMSLFVGLKCCLR